MGASLIKLQDVTKIFATEEVETHALSSISVEINKGDYVSIAGPSGCGKSTLLSILGLLDSPSEGLYVLNNNSVANLGLAERARIRNREVGFIFQSFQLLPSLTALENVMVPAEIRGENHARSRATDLLQQVGLDGRLQHYPIQLSGGEQQRVAIARAFMNRPKILFADEPTGNLDGETAKEIVRLIFNLNATAGTTLILVTHDNDLTRQAGRVISLRAGRLLSDTLTTVASPPSQEA